jgi:hypothetical protein
LRRLWNLNSNLQFLAEHKGNSGVSGAYQQERFQQGLRNIGKQWHAAGYDLVPLVTPDMGLRCSLDILLLRPEEDRFIFRMGDVDGQLKTLFDALRMPANLEEAGGTGPQEDEAPFFCLLQDDRLISEVRVTTDQLLLLPNHREVKANDAHAVIHVKLNHKNARTFDNYFG